MTREDAIERLRKARPSLSKETNDALEVALVDCMTLNQQEKHPVYYCDPKKNKDCAKYGCFEIGGPCYSTTKIECSVMFKGRSLRAPILEVGLCD